MNAKNQMRRVFFSVLLRQLGVVWPILSGVLLVMVGSGLAIGFLERWGVGDSLYFTFVTGLTIGYGRGGSVCLDRFPGLLSGASAGWYRHGALAA